MSTQSGNRIIVNNFWERLTRSRCQSKNKEENQKTAILKIETKLSKGIEFKEFRELVTLRTATMHNK